MSVVRCAAELTVTVDVARRVLQAAIGKLRGRFRRGFEALQAQARDGALRNMREPRVSAAEGFLARRCVFRRGARVPRATLFSAHERDAIERGYSPHVPTLRQALTAHHIRVARMRTPWSSSAAAFVGVALAPNAAELPSSRKSRIA